ncbi:glycoside hydrolase family 43 protein [Catenovulum sediminis]|uniref:Glycoside hydrolase family 43 protein n=1 Tax=Catenovulum sediminis TaxID=1740262 RepID=A0ABV1RN69_9ALTE|nr:glycoside hydrolase family 43 protein [Catenovulum sediminis]
MTPSDAEVTNQIDIQRAKELKGISEPLVTHMYTADPSAHVFNGTLYIYPSHDIETNEPMNDDGDHFAMRDYHVFSLEQPQGIAKDHGVALDIADVPWASKQMWAPDAAEKDGTYYLYFPARDKAGIFRIGVASSQTPYGPFVAQDDYIQGTYSIDPAVYNDNGDYYLYFGGIWGGQLQRWHNNELSDERYPAENEVAIKPRVAKLTNDMISLAEQVREITLLDEQGQEILAGDTDRRFFEGPWLHKYAGTYYFSYSTGDTHKIVYATSDNPYGPFTYKGVILNPVLGWTTHHSIAQYQGKWYLFYHDSSLSGGQTHLRSIKMTELIHQADGTIKTIDPYEQI